MFVSAMFRGRARSDTTKTNDCFYFETVLEDSADGECFLAIFIHVGDTQLITPLLGPHV